MTFKEGGAFDFHTNFERIKERLEQAVENTGDSAQGLRSVDLAAVHLEELPAYEGPSNPSPPADSNDALRVPANNQRSSLIGAEPVEPPPGYEEVQQQSVAQSLEERLREAS